MSPHEKGDRKTSAKQPRHRVVSLRRLAVPTLPVILLQMRMRPRQLVSLLLLTSWAAVGAEELTTAGVMWQAANVRDAVKTLATEEVSPGSELLCAVEASQRSWCTFYCYIGGVCSLYDFAFPPSAFPPTVNCKTSTPSRGGECWPPGVRLGEGVAAFAILCPAWAPL